MTQVLFTKQYRCNQLRDVTAVLQCCFKNILLEGYFSFSSTDRSWFFIFFSFPQDFVSLLVVLFVCFFFFQWEKINCFMREQIRSLQKLTKWNFLVVISGCMSVKEQTEMKWGVRFRMLRLEKSSLLAKIEFHINFFYIFQA